MAREGRGETSPGLCKVTVCAGCVEIVSFGVVVTTTLHDGLHRGEMGAAAAFLASAERGWSRSGERARRSKGDPGSADLGRLKDFLAEPGVRHDPGL